MKSQLNWLFAMFMILAPLTASLDASYDDSVVARGGGGGGRGGGGGGGGGGRGGSQAGRATAGRGARTNPIQRTPTMSRAVVAPVVASPYYYSSDDDYDDDYDEINENPALDFYEDAAPSSWQQY